MPVVAITHPVVLAESIAHQQQRSAQQHNLDYELSQVVYVQIAEELR